MHDIQTSCQLFALVVPALALPQGIHGLRGSKMGYTGLHAPNLGMLPTKNMLPSGKLT